MATIVGRPRPREQTIWRVKAETRNFTFEAFGNSLDQAEKVFWRGWRRHCKYTGARPDYINDNDLRCEAFALGQCYRDGSRL